jgi:hypothetical protein
MIRQHFLHDALILRGLNGNRPTVDRLLKCHCLGFVPAGKRTPDLELGQRGLHFFGGVLVAGAAGDFDAAAEGLAGFVDSRLAR